MSNNAETFSENNCIPIIQSEIYMNNIHTCSICHHSFECKDFEPTRGCSCTSNDAECFSCIEIMLQKVQLTKSEKKLSV